MILLPIRKKKKRKPCWYLPLQVCPRQLQLFLKSPPVFDSGVLHHITSDPTFIGSKALRVSPPFSISVMAATHASMSLAGVGSTIYF